MNDQEATIIGSIASLTAILGFAIGLGIGALREQSALDRMKSEYVPRNQAVNMEYIDRDELSDFVIGNKILLADKTDKGIVYRPLRNSDIYRLK